HQELIKWGAETYPITHQNALGLQVRIHEHLNADHPFSKAIQATEALLADAKAVLPQRTRVQLLWLLKHHREGVQPVISIADNLLNLLAAVAKENSHAATVVEHLNAFLYKSTAKGLVRIWPRCTDLFASILAPGLPEHKDDATSRYKRDLE